MPLAAQLAKLLAASLSKQTKGAQEVMSFPTGSVMKHEPTMRVLTPEQEAASYAPIRTSSYELPPEELAPIAPVGTDEVVPLQEVTSKKTSRKQIPALFKSNLFDEPPGSRNLDLGGGRYTLGTDWLKKNKDIDNSIVDKYWKTEEENNSILKQFENDPADSVTINNVLNVIKEQNVRRNIIEDSFKYLNPNKKAYFQIYEGDGKEAGSGVGRETKDGWQNYKKTKDYLTEVEEVYGKGNVEKKGKNILIATKSPQRPALRQQVEDLGLSEKEQEIIRSTIDQPLYHTSRSAEKIETFDPEKLKQKAIKGNIASGLGLYTTPSLLHSRANYYTRIIPQDIQNKYIQKGEVNKLVDAEELYRQGKLSPEEIEDLIYDAYTYEIKLNEDFNPIVILNKKDKIPSLKKLTAKERDDFLIRNPDYEVGPIIKHKGVWKSQQELEEIGFEGVIDAREKFLWKDKEGKSKHEVVAWPSALSKVKHKLMRGIGAREVKPKKGKTREEIELQGGPLSTKLNEQKIGRILDEHNIEWEYNDNGGITAIEEFSKGPSRKKYFKRNTSLKTVRDWLGYAKGGVVDMRNGGKVGAAVVAASLMASGGQAMDMRNGGVVGMVHGGPIHDGPVIDFVTPEEDEFNKDYDASAEVSKQMEALLAKRQAAVDYGGGADNILARQAAVDYGGFEQPAPVLPEMKITQEETEVLNTPPRHPRLPSGSKKNNPGNLELSGNWAGMVGTYGDERRLEKGKSPFAKFSHPVMGLRALARDFKTKITRHKGSIKEIFKQYAPENENKTQEYINFVQKQVGKKKITEEDLGAVIRAVIKFENKKEDRDYYLSNPKWVQEGIELSEISMPIDIIDISQARAAYTKFKKEQGRPLEKPRIKSR